MSQSFINATTLDDTSSNITYSGNWTRKGDIPPGYNLYHNTDAWSNDQGATATLIFFGTSVDYWGNQEDTRGPCELAIDGAVVTTVNANAPVVTGEVIQLFTSGNLPLEQHTLVIRVASALSANRCEVDRFVVSTSINAVATPAPTASSNVGPVSASIPVTAPIPITTGSSTVATHNTSTNSTGSHLMSVSTTSGVGVSTSLPTATVTIPASANVAAVGTQNPKPPISSQVIIGGIFGALALVGLFIFLWWFYKRPRGLRRRPFMHFTDGDSLDAESSPDPFAPHPYPMHPPRMKGMEAFQSVSSLHGSSEEHMRTDLDDQGYSSHSQVPSSFVVGTETVTKSITGLETSPYRTNFPSNSNSRLSIVSEERPPAYYDAL